MGIVNANEVKYIAEKRKLDKDRNSLMNRL